MRYLSSGIGDFVLEELKLAESASLATAFFSPDPRMLAAIVKLKKLTLVISEEFTVNNPYIIEKLALFDVLSLPTYSEAGKLHAKVFVIKRSDGSHCVVIGSANFTHGGLFSNQEACICLDSREAGDCTVIAEVQAWFAALLRLPDLGPPDIERAKSIFDARSKLRLVMRPPNEDARPTGYWVLKTTAGSSGREHFPEFLANNVIAIGWSAIKEIDPSQVKLQALIDALKEAYPKDSAKIAAGKIRKFIDIKIGDILFLCRGYTAVQKKDVRILGVARVTGPFKIQQVGDWRFTHEAVIQEIDTQVERDAVALALGKGALRETIHSLDEEHFNQFATLLRERGIQIEV